MPKLALTRNVDREGGFVVWSDDGVLLGYADPDEAGWLYFTPYEMVSLYPWQLKQIADALNDASRVGGQPSVIHQRREP